MSQTTVARRGRPRDGSVYRRVRGGAWGLLHAGGYAALNMDEVAERAEVAKTTLYRRWPTKDHLAVAVAAQILGEVPIPDTGDLRRDLTEFATALAPQPQPAPQGGPLRRRRNGRAGRRDSRRDRSPSRHRRPGPRRVRAAARP